MKEQPGLDPLAATAVAPSGEGASAETVVDTDTTPERVDTGGGAALPAGPRYLERRLLGRGGMGAVHACRDARIGREVAVKRMLSAEGPTAVARFLREARIQGQLEHPAIVPVHDLEEADGLPFFVMKRVRGVGLDEALAALAAGAPEAERRYGLRRLLSAFVTVCLAVDFAHARGVLHRDLKPANVMLGDYGEVHLLDWGVARVVGSREPDGEGVDVGAATRGTVHGSIIGTPGYMSPEQARGEVEGLDARADVYALGAILFELLARQPLHRGRSAAELLASTLEGAVDPRPSERSPALDVPPELDAVCVRALALDPAERFRSARELSEAVERYLDGDRDLAMRRELAERHAAAARAALARVGERGEVGRVAREEALREATRAVALDPKREAGADVVARVLLEVPDELPPEAEAAMEAAQAEGREGAARVSTLRGVAMVVLAPVVAWMGIESKSLYALLASLLVLLTISNFVWWRVRKGKLERPLDFVPFLVSLGLLACLSRFFGPFTLTPTLALLNGALFSVQTGYRLPFGWAAASSLAAMGPWLLEQAGVLPRTVWFEGSQMVVQAVLARFEPTITPVILGLITFMSTSAPLFLLQKLRRLAEQNERRVFLHAWHLKRLYSPERPEPLG